MQIVSVDVSSDFIDNLLHGKQGNTPHHNGGCKPGSAWKPRDYRQTVEKFLDSEKPVMLVLLEEEDIAYRISSGFAECVKRNKIQGVKARVRNGLVYLVRTDREEK